MYLLESHLETPVRGPEPNMSVINMAKTKKKKKSLHRWGIFNKTEICPKQRKQENLRGRYEIRESKNYSILVKIGILWDWMCMSTKWDFKKSGHSTIVFTASRMHTSWGVTEVFPKMLTVVPALWVVEFQETCTLCFTLVYVSGYFKTSINHL